MSVIGFWILVVLQIAKSGIICPLFDASEMRLGELPLVRRALESTRLDNEEYAAQMAVVRRLLFDEDNCSGALSKVDSVLQHWPNDASATGVKGLALIRSGRLADAARLEKRLRDDDYYCLCVRGWLKLWRGDNEAARRCFTGAISKDPYHEVAWSFLGIAAGDLTHLPDNDKDADELRQQIRMVAQHYQINSTKVNALFRESTSPFNIGQRFSFPPDSDHVTIHFRLTGNRMAVKVSGPSHEYHVIFDTGASISAIRESLKNSDMAALGSETTSADYDGEETNDDYALHDVTVGNAHIDPWLFSLLSNDSTVPIQGFDGVFAAAQLLRYCVVVDNAHSEIGVYRSTPPSMNNASTHVVPIHVYNGCTLILLSDLTGAPGIAFLDSGSAGTCQFSLPNQSANRVENLNRPDNRPYDLLVTCPESHFYACALHRVAMNEPGGDILGKHMHLRISWILGVSFLQQYSKVVIDYPAGKLYLVDP